MMLSDSCNDFVSGVGSAAADFLNKVVARSAAELKKKAEQHSGAHFNYSPEIAVLKKAAEALSASPLDVDLCIPVLKFARWYDLLQNEFEGVDSQRLQTEMTYFAMLIEAHLDAKPLDDPQRPVETWSPQHVRTFHHLWAAHIASQTLPNPVSTFHIDEAIRAVIAGAPFKFSIHSYWDRTNNFAKVLTALTEELQTPDP